MDVGVPRSKTTSTCVKQSTCDLVNAKGSCLAMKHSNDEVCTIVYEFEYGPLPPNFKHFVSTSCMYSLIPRPSASSTCIIAYTSYNRNAQVIPFSLPSTTSRTLSAWHFGSRMALSKYIIVSRAYILGRIYYQGRIEPPKAARYALDSIY